MVSLNQQPLHSFRARLVCVTLPLPLYHLIWWHPNKLSSFPNWIDHEEIQICSGSTKCALLFQGARKPVTCQYHLSDFMRKGNILGITFPTSSVMSHRRSFFANLKCSPLVGKYNRHVCIGMVHTYLGSCSDTNTNSWQQQSIIVATTPDSHYSQG